MKLVAKGASRQEYVVSHTLRKTTVLTWLRAHEHIRVLSQESAKVVKVEVREMLPCV
jgi:uncharacterized protein YjiK